MTNKTFRSVAWLRALFTACLLSVAACIPVDETATTLSTHFHLSAQFSGNQSSAFGGLSIGSNTGTLTIRGEAKSAVVYERIPWPEFGYTLYQGIAVDSAQMFPFWIYCNADGTMSSIYVEGTKDFPLTNFYTPGGSCSQTLGQNSVSVSLPATILTVPQPVTGFTVTGSNLSISPDGTGQMTLNGVPHEVTVFESVDCTQVCGGSGWYELHALVHKPDTSAVSFVVLYLYINSPGYIQAAYDIQLPWLTDTIPQTFTAQWSKQ